jgi:hypothetical protein
MATNPKQAQFKVAVPAEFEHIHHFDVAFFNEVGTLKSGPFNAGKGVRDAGTGVVTLDLPGALFEGPNYNAGDDIPGFVAVRGMTGANGENAGEWEKVNVTVTWEVGENVITDLILL